MRWVLALLVLLTASEASALVISDPPMVRKCPRGRTWNAVMTCLSQHYTPKVSREIRGAKLVTLWSKTKPPTDNGILLYVERNGSWQIGGRYETYGGEYAVLGLSAVTVGKRVGYRLDLGTVSPTTVLVDNISPVPAVLRTRRSMFCSGDSYVCADAMTACELTVGGLAWFVFRGTLAMVENAVVIDGDRSQSGPYCSGQPKVFLGWRQ